MNHDLPAEARPSRSSARRAGLRATSSYVNVSTFFVGLSILAFWLTMSALGIWPVDTLREGAEPGNCAAANLTTYPDCSGSISSAAGLLGDGGEAWRRGAATPATPLALAAAVVTAPTTGVPDYRTTDEWLRRAVLVICVAVPIGLTWRRIGIGAAVVIGLASRPVLLAATTFFPTALIVPLLTGVALSYVRGHWRSLAVSIVLLALFSPAALILVALQAAHRRWRDIVIVLSAWCVAMVASFALLPGFPRSVGFWLLAVLRITVISPSLASLIALVAAVACAALVGSRVNRFWTILLLFSALCLVVRFPSLPVGVILPVVSSLLLLDSRGRSTRSTAGILDGPGPRGGLAKYVTLGVVAFGMAPFAFPARLFRNRWFDVAGLTDVSLQVAIDTSELRILFATALIAALTTVRSSAHTVVSLETSREGCKT